MYCTRVFSFFLVGWLVGWLIWPIGSPELNSYIAMYIQGPTNTITILYYTIHSTAYRGLSCSPPPLFPPSFFFSPRFEKKFSRPKRKQQATNILYYTDTQANTHTQTRKHTSSLETKKKKGVIRKAGSQKLLTSATDLITNFFFSVFLFRFFWSFVERERYAGRLILIGDDGCKDENKERE